LAIQQAVLVDKPPPASQPRPPRRSLNRIALVVASLGLALVACRGDDAPPGDDTMIDAPALPTEVTIQEVQNDAMPSGTAIELKGVVVTLRSIPSQPHGDFFVSERAVARIRV